MNFIALTPGQIEVTTSQTQARRQLMPQIRHSGPSCQLGPENRKWGTTDARP